MTALAYLTGLAVGALLVFVYFSKRVYVLQNKYLIEMIAHERTKADLRLHISEYKQLSKGLYKMLKEGYE